MITPSMRRGQDVEFRGQNPKAAAPRFIMRPGLVATSNGSPVSSRRPSRNHLKYIDRIPPSLKSASLTYCCTNV